MTYDVIFQPDAENDLREIYHFIARDSPNAAGQWIERLEEAARSLSIFPRRGPLAPENGSFDDEIRNIFIGDYRVLFTVVERDRRVHVLHIRHAARRPLESDS
jgi:toxin ParE1/3/4